MAYRYLLGTFRHSVREFGKNLWRAYTPILENLREILATEFDDSDTDLEDLTEDFDASDIAEDDPDVLTSVEGTPLGDLGTGTPSLLVNLLDYSTDSFQVLELTNVFHYLFGLDSVDGAGFIEREFDINLIIRSLWAVEVLYYSPSVGGFVLINFQALLDFIQVVFLDQRN